MSIKTNITGLFYFVSLVVLQAQFAKHVQVLQVGVNTSKMLSGSLSEGRYVDMRFGLRPALHCFTAVQKNYFSGHHVLYAVKVPANTKVLVELNTRSDMSLYGYMIDASKYDIPPYVEVVSKMGCTSSMLPVGQADRIMMKAGTVDTHVIFAACGIEEANKGAYTLKITTRS